MRFQGIGTEKLQVGDRSEVPRLRLQRMDSDTMQKPGSHRRVLDAFREGRIHILMGTQMIAKGLDFPNVTLVGVVNADVGLHMPDFRASERTFQLLAQVAGRTGRGDHPAARCWCRPSTPSTRRFCSPSSTITFHSRSRNWRFAMSMAIRRTSVWLG